MRIDFKIWVVVGTRPEVIKQVPLYRALVRTFGKQKVGLIGTGQHRELLEQALSHFGEKLDLNLGLMQPGQTLGQSAASIHMHMEREIADSKPELVIVQGDTTTAAMCAIAAFHHNVKIAHNEAGLRTYDLQNPYPEEANRKFIGCVADMHFAPTQTAKNALLHEKVDPAKIFVVGNTGIDALLWTINEKECPQQTQEIISIWKNRGIKPVLVTAHRRENDPSKMDTWFQSLGEFVNARKDIALVCPMHPNNRALSSAGKYLGNNDRVWTGPPLDYASVCHLLKECRFIVTDSGGLQEESATLGVPCVICRKVTERPEAVDSGIAKLADPVDGNKILDAMAWAYEHANLPLEQRMRIPKPFGDGTASEQIAKIIAEVLQ